MNTNIPIPDDLLNKVSTRAQKVLLREKIFTCEQLLDLQEIELFNIDGVGTTTVCDIQQLKNKIVQLYPELTESHKNTQLLVSNYSSSNGPLQSCLLSCTLPKIFQVVYPNYDYSDDAAQISISSLGISEPDLNRLGGITLFPDDPADILFHVTIGYLLKAEISEEALLTILTHLSRISGFTDQSQMIISTEALSDAVIFNGLPTSVVAELQLLQYPTRNTINSELMSMIWENIGILSEKKVISQMGFSIQSLNVIQQVWWLKDKALELMNTVSKGVPVEAYVNYERLIDAFLLTVVKREREVRILKGRLGLQDGRKWTLEELGRRERLTRERVRQIEGRYIVKIQKPKTIGLLNMFWHAVDDVLLAGGGVCSAQEVTDFLGRRWGWLNCPSDATIASLIGLSTQYNVVWNSPILIIMPKHQCVRCLAIRSEISSLVKSQPEGLLSFEYAIAMMMKFCKGKAFCDNVSSIVQFSNGYLHFLGNAIENIFADESSFYTPSTWTLKHGKTLTLIAETILHNACRPMHFTEVCAEINKDRPEHEKISERNTHASVARSTKLLLWDRGTYIHRDYVSIPCDLVTEIEGNIIYRLGSEIPYLSVSGIFEQYKDKLQKGNIPSESALYSCLRESSNSALMYPEYPYIMRCGAIEKRLPLPLVIEAYVMEQEGVVKLAQIKKYVIEQLCVNEALFNAYGMPNAPNVLRVNRGEYLHMRYIGLQKKGLTPITDYINVLLCSSGHISVIKVFNDKKITCKLLGITTPMLLFSIIQSFCSDEYDTSQYPRIRLPSEQIDNGHATGVATEIIRYILEKAEPCSFAELYEHFVDTLGYKQNSVHNVLYSHDDIMRYSDGVIVHYDTLRWTEDMQATLELLAANYLSNRESAGTPFGLISHFFDYMHDRLPVLHDHIYWTPTLLGELLSRKGKYRIIGSQRNAFVSIPNSCHIESLDDLLYYVLSADYDGAANLSIFVADMREAGILKKGLTPMMLGAESRIVIDGNVIQLAELQDSVERT